ncbi:MAG: InlB B-repeat-containing protein [Paludibacteraceae bacterium]|nr:InlB B-repeat-containing protein [Paludibacteraceae bacterium]
MSKHLRFIGACLCLLFSMTMQAQEQKVPYAVGSYYEIKNDGPRKGRVFYYTDIYTTCDSLYEEVPYGYDTLVIKYGYMPKTENAFEINCDGKTWWKNDVDSFFAYSETIIIDPSMKECPLKTTANMFANCTSVSYLKGLNNLNTDSVTDMSGMFYKCYSLGKYLDFTDFDTRNVTKMDSMFANMGLFNLNRDKNLDYSDKWSIARYGYTFDLRGFDTRNVTSMEKMFCGLYWVDTLDISSFDTRKVTNMANMFSNYLLSDEIIHTFKTIYVGDDWSVASLKESTDGIFGKDFDYKGVCQLWGGLGTSSGVLTHFYSYEVAHVDGGIENPGLFTSHNPKTFPTIYGMYEYQDRLLKIYYGVPSEEAYIFECEQFPFSPLEPGGNKFYGVDNWRQLNEPPYFRALRSNEVVQVVIDSTVKYCSPKTLTSFFYGFEKLISIDGLENLRMDSVRAMCRMFTGCKSMSSIDLHKLDTRNVTDISDMFYACEALETIYVGVDWSMSNLKNDTLRVFEGCSNLVGGAGTEWTSSATSAKYAHIDGGADDPGYLSLADTLYIDGLKYSVTNQGKREMSVGYADLAGDTIVIPEKVQIDGTDYTVTGIMDEGFINQFKLKSVVIPESVTEIGEKAFYENHNIISLDIPSSVSSIGASAFTSILNVAYAGNAEGGPWGANVLNGEVDYDLKYVFSDSTRTKIVRCFGHDSIIVIPNTVKELGRNSFAKIIELKSVDLNNVEKIDDKAFTYTGLQEISLSNKIKYIGERAFFNTYIKKILLPSSVDTMGSSAFSITDTVYCRWTTVPVGKQYHRGWNYKVNTVIYNCKLLNVSVANSDSSTVEVSGHVGIDAEGAYWYEDSASATIKAVPCKGYEFVQWSDNVNENPRTFIITADTAIAAEFKGENYVITYKVDGKVYQKDTVACGDSIIEIPSPKKEGYIFVGWENLQGSMPANNLTVNAIFVPKKYLLTYIVDGEVYQVDSVAYGDTIVTPKDPKKENMIFDSWIELPTTMPAKNLTVTGFFLDKPFVLTYKVDGKVYHRDTLTSGSDIMAIGAPNKEGYTFTGWKNLLETMPAKNLTVTAMYEINYYTITFWANSKIFQLDTVAYGDTIVAPKAPEKEGYTFAGWSDFPETMPARNLSVSSSFKINHYTLTTMVDGKVFRQDTLMYGEYIHDLELPMKEGYVFEGWDTLPSYMPAKDVIVTAKLRAITYYIYYLVNEEVYQVDSAICGDTIVAIAYPKKENYVFSGWNNIPTTMPARDMTIRGTLSGKPYVLTYMVNGEVYYRDTVKYESFVAPIEGPDIEGYSFFDWDDIPVRMPAKNLTVTALLEVNLYTITYKVDNKVYQRDSIAFGDTVVAIKKPTKEGYTFNGWKNVPTTMPAKDVTVTGSFKVNSYVITYKVDDKVYQTDTLAYGDTIMAAKEPKKEGATFSGWSKLPETMPAKDLIVTGTFSGKSYVITYKVNDKVYQRDTLNQGSTVVAAEEPEMEGYTFRAWENLPETMPAKNVTVTALFVVNTYALTYKIDGEVYQQDSIAFGDNVVAIKKPTKEGYTFSGWKNVPTTMPAKNVTVTGSFKAKNYVITYKVDDKVYQTDTLAYGDIIVAAEEPKKEGATFSGWSKLPETMPAKDLIVTGTFSGKSYVITYKVNGKVYQRDTLNQGSTVIAAEEPEMEGYTFSVWENLPETMPAKNVTVTAMFAVNTYALTYKVDGEVYQQDSIAFGDTVVAIKKPTKEGYTFSGWKNLPTTMPAKDVTVTGSFKAKNYVITYKVDDKVYQTDTVAYGETIVAAKEPKKEGATFSGWSKLPETMPAQNLIVTGTFSGKSYAITYKVDGKLYQRDTLNQGSTVIAAEEPEKEGYTFSGWENVPETMPAKNVTVNGTFTVNDYILTYMVDEDVYYTDTLHYGDAIPEIEAPEKKNYVFNGWIELPETMPAEDLTVIASFRPYSGVDEHNSETTLVWSADKMIFIQVEKSASYVVYDMLGYIMAQGVAVEGDTQIAMPAQGVYQVVVDKSRHTVLVR